MPIRATNKVWFDRPVSPEVNDAAIKLGEGFDAVINALGAPDAEELFDVVLVSAASFFAIGGTPNKQMRRAILARFDECLRRQSAATVTGER